MEMARPPKRSSRDFRFRTWHLRHSFRIRIIPTTKKDVLNQ
jgi:hypothetical protein